jgi:hypothetical protein
MADLVRIINVENNLNIKYWEITNEIDDNFQGGTDCGNSVNFCDKPFSELIRIYNASVLAMKQVDSSIKTGGLGYQNPWQNVDAFLDGTIPAGTLDFVSYHAYDGSGNPVRDLDTLFMRSKQTVKDLGIMFVNKVNTKSPNKKIEIFHDEYNICYLYRCGFADNNDSNRRMAGQEGAIYDALGYIYAIESGIDSLMTWNEKDMYYGKLDQFYKKRPSGMLLEMIDKLKIVKIVPHLTTNSSTNEGSIKTLAFLTSDNKKGLLAVNRSSINQTLTISNNTTIVSDEYELDDGFLNSNLGVVSVGNKSLNIPNYSVVAIVFQDTPSSSSSSQSSLLSIISSISSTSSLSSSSSNLSSTQSSKSSLSSLSSLSSQSSSQNSSSQSSISSQVSSSFSSSSKSSSSSTSNSLISSQSSSNSQSNCIYVLPNPCSTSSSSLSSSSSISSSLSSSSSNLSSTQSSKSSLSSLSSLSSQSSSLNSKSSSSVSSSIFISLSSNSSILSQNSSKLSTSSSSNPVVNTTNYVNSIRFGNYDSLNNSNNSNSSSNSSTSSNSNSAILDPLNTKDSNARSQNQDSKSQQNDQSEQVFKDGLGITKKSFLNKPLTVRSGGQTISCLLYILISIFALMFVLSHYKNKKL